MVERDTTRFLRDDGRLDIRLIPRQVYIAMLERYTSQPQNVDRVFAELFWLWDLNDRAAKAAAAGRGVSRVELAKELMAEMDDRDWWKVTETFEMHLMRDYATQAAVYADLLDPVYDLQEAEGGRALHFEVAGQTR